MSIPRACGLAVTPAVHRKSFRSFPACIPLQGIINNTRRASEVSLKRLIPLVEYIGAWQCLPSISPWILRTVQRGYRPPKLNGLGLDCGAPRAGSGDGTEKFTEAIERVPPLDRESGFHGRYFIVPKKHRGLSPILGVSGDSGSRCSLFLLS